MSFAATQMDLDSVILSEVSQTEKVKYCDIPYMWNLKSNDTNELTSKTETSLQTQRTNLWFPERWQGEEQLGSLGWTCTHCYILNG